MPNHLRTALAICYFGFYDDLLLQPHRHGMAEAPELPLESKRKPKCSGCGTTFEEHHWGTPGPYCTGNTSILTPPHFPGPASGKAADDEEDEEATLVQQLESLSLAEEELTKRSRIAQLRAAVAKKQERIEQLQRQVQGAPAPERITNAATVGNVADLRKLAELEELVTRGPPLDDLLQAQQPVAQPRSWLEAPTNRAAPPPQNPSMLSSEMFLKPRRIPSGEKVLKIIDFADKIIPRDEERTLSAVGTAKIVVSYGPNKPKLESITLSQWVVANTRIFYTLLQGGNLPTPTDIQHYLAYTVKIMELSARFTWVSILNYDDEFRHLQATYQYPWCFDSNHLHTVTLQPLPPGQGGPSKSAGTGNKSSAANNVANFTADGRIICKNFNRSRCNLLSCNFAHVCNRKVNGKACGSQHSNAQHTNSPAETQSPNKQ